MREALGQEAFLAYVAEGRALELDAAVERALSGRPRPARAARGSGCAAGAACRRDAEARRLPTVKGGEPTG